MEKAYINTTSEESTALPSGEGSSIGSQWDAGLDLDMVQTIITSSFQKQGYQTSSRNVNGAQSGEMSLEEEVNSLDLKQVVIDDDEIKEMEKEQANAAIREEQNVSEHLTNVYSSVDVHTGRENISVEENRQTTSANDLLSDIDSVIASSLSPANSSLANGWIELPDWRIANGQQNRNELKADLNIPGTRNSMKNQAHTSSPSSTPTDQHLQLSEEGSCPFSPSSALLMKSPSITSDVSSQQDNTFVKSASPKLSPGIGSFQKSPQSFHSQAANSQDRTLQQNEVGAVEIADNAVVLLQQQDNLLSSASSQHHAQNQDALSVKDLGAGTDCQMCPVRYADDEDDCVSNDLDEYCSSGELIPHGRGSGRGRPKSTQPIRSSVPCKIRPKTDLPTYSNNLIPVTVTVRKDDNKNCIELHPIVSQDPHKPVPSVSSGISSPSIEAVSPPVDNSLLPDSVKSPSMECVERDGPISLTGSSHHVLGPGQIPPVIHAQKVLSLRQGYHPGPQYNGTVFTHQSIRSQPNHHLPHAAFQAQGNLPQCLEGLPIQCNNNQSAHPSRTMTSYKNLKNSNSEICITGHQHMVSTQQPSMLAYQEIHPEPSRMAASYYTEHPSIGSNLVVADPKQLEKAGIPYIIISQASAPNHPNAQCVIQTSANSVHTHKPHLPQPRISSGGNTQMYQQTPSGNPAAIQIVEQPVYNRIQPGHYIRDPQNQVPSAYHVPPCITSTASEEPSNLSSSRIIYQLPQQRPVTVVQDTTLPSTVDLGKLSSSTLRSSGMREPVRTSINGFHPLTRNNSSHLNPKLDCRGIPKEDRQSRIEAWILQNSKISSHHVHPYESYRLGVSCSGAGPTLPPKAVGLFQGVEIKTVPNSGPDIKKNSGNTDAKHKGAKKGRASGKVKEVDTIDSHQGYIKKLPSRVQVNGQCSQEANNLDTAKPLSHDLSNTHKQIMPVQIENNMSKNNVLEELNVLTSERYQDRMRCLRKDFAEADKEINKIVYERSMRDSQRKSALSSLEKCSALFDEPLFDYSNPSDTTGQNLEVIAASSISQATASSQVWNFDPNRYLSSKDKESLEDKIRRQKNSLEKYLGKETSNNDHKNILNEPSSQTCFENHLISSGNISQLPVHCDDSLVVGHLDHSQHQKSAHPPKEMAKIDILAWQQQSVSIVKDMSVVHQPDVAEPQFDIANPSANDFPQLMQTLTSLGDEDMKSASLELSGTSRNATAKHCLNPGHMPFDPSVPSCLSQRHMSSACNVQTNSSTNNCGEVSMAPLEQCFRKPHQPAIKNPYSAKCLPYGNANTDFQQTSLSACISHTQPLMASSIALASSQPMSSIKGESDVSMQSDLSRQSRQDRSMASVDGKHQQIPEVLKQVQSAAVSKDKNRINQHESSRVKEWLENHETFLRQPNSDDQKLCQEPVNTVNTLRLNIPNYLDVIDQQEIPQQHQLVPEVRPQKFQEHQVLQQIPPPSSPPFVDHLHNELEFVVPGFSPTDLMPRSATGKPDQPPTHSQSSSQSLKGKRQTSTSSLFSQAIGSETSTSSSSPLPLSSKESLTNQKTTKTSSATTVNISRPTDSVTTSSPACHNSISGPPVVSKGDHSQMVSSRPSAKSGSNHSSPKSSQIIKTKDSSKASPPHKASDVLVVGERMKASVKISPTSKPPLEGGAAADVDEEEDVEELGDGEEKEEEELSFTGSDVFRPDDQGETILHCLCDIPVDHFEVLESAPGFEEAVNSSSKAQETPLFVGVHNRRPDIAKFLMKKGADASIPCISPANTFRNEPLLQSVVHEAAELGDAKTLNVLLQSEDVDIDLPRPGSGQTPLMVALHVHSFAHRNPAADRTRVVKLLLTQGASMTIQDAVEGKTPFMYAIQSRDVKIVNTFFHLMDADEARDAVTTKTSRSTTCLHFAAGLSNFDRSQKMELIRILILNGADTSSKNAEGESPRDWARDEIDEVLKRLVPGK